MLAWGSFWLHGAAATGGMKLSGCAFSVIFQQGRKGLIRYCSETFQIKWGRSYETVETELAVLPTPHLDTLGIKEQSNSRT